MEQDFGERLKKYRREKGFTQQELADLIQVSNKTISRWESSGGYPDVPMLVPLARTLGVTVDDLLDREMPIRTLTQADWQSMLSFAFALGGGVCFYLLNLFMPVVICYLVYLGCMCYGVYLQKHYAYQSRWFYIGNTIMNLAVNITMVCSSAATIFALMGMDNWTELILGIAAPGYILAGCLLAAVVLTALMLYLAPCLSIDQQTVHVRLRVQGGGWLRFFPALGMLLLTLFWSMFQPEGLTQEPYLKQSWIYYSLLSVLVLLCLFFFSRRGHRIGLLPATVMTLGGLKLPGLAKAYAWLPISGKAIEVTPDLSELYAQIRVLTPVLAMAGAALTLLCLVLALIYVVQKEETEE